MALETQVFLLHASLSLTTGIQCFKEEKVLFSFVNGTQISLWQYSEEYFKSLNAKMSIFLSLFLIFLVTNIKWID